MSDLVALSHSVSSGEADECEERKDGEGESEVTRKMTDPMNRSGVRACGGGSADGLNWMGVESTKRMRFSAAKQTPLPTHTHESTCMHRCDDSEDARHTMNYTTIVCTVVCCVVSCCCLLVDAGCLGRVESSSRSTLKKKHTTCAQTGCTVWMASIPYV